MKMLPIALLISLCALGTSAFAGFTGPSVSGTEVTVQQARRAQPETYVTVTGNIVNRLREDYFTFRDETGEIRVEIDPELWRGRDVGPENQVRLLAEVDRNRAGTIYLSVESLEILK
jgi:uncharacterized protein (TIGR00156 family)